MDLINKVKKNKIFWLVMVIAWSIFTFGVYYWLHKPVPPTLFLSTLNPLGDIITAILMVSLCGGLGRGLISGEPFSALERFGLQAALGSGIISLGWLGLGLLGVYSPWLAWLLLAGLLILLRRPVRHWWMELASLKGLFSQAGRIEKILAFSAGLLLFYQLLLALAPPTHWDALAYHLALPQLFARSGKIIFVPSNFFWGNPQLGEMLFSFAMTLLRVQTAVVLNVLLGAIFLIGLAGFTLRQTQKLAGFDERMASRAAWAAVAAILAGFTARHELSWAYVDILAAPMGLALLICAFQWLDSRQDRWLNWSGVFLGLAIGVKYPSALLGLALYLVVLWKGRPFKSTFWAVIRSGLISLFVFAPWLVKNWIFSGNPFYPYFFPTVWASAARVSAASLSSGTSIPLVLNLFYPVTVNLFGGEDGLWFAGELGVLGLWLGVVGLWLFWPKIEGKIMALALFLVWGMAGGVSYVLWQFSQTRIYFVMLPILGVMAGAGWGILQSWAVKGIRLRRILGVLLLLVMFLVCWQDSVETISTGPLLPALGIQSTETYLENQLGWYALTMKALDNLSPTSKVLMLWEPRGLYAPNFAQPDTWIDNWRTAFWSYHDATGILQAWRTQGFTHVLFYKSGAEIIRQGEKNVDKDGWPVLDEVLKSLPPPVSYGDVYYLYDIRAK